MIILFQLRVEVEEPPSYVADETEGKREMDRILSDLEGVVNRNTRHSIDNSKWEISHERPW